MKKLFLAFIILFAFQAYGKDPQVAAIRQSFYELTLNSAETKEKLAEIRSIKNPSGIITAYEAAMEALMAKVAWNPISKIGHVKSSQKIFMKALEMDPNNVEIRFLRFSVEWHIPKWLGYSKHLQDDKNYIMSNFQKFDVSCISEDMLDFINRFLKNSGWYSSEELNLISKIIKK